MAQINLVKQPDGKLRGMSDRDQAAYTRFRSRLNNAAPGEIIEIEAKLPRNSKFHRKFFVLLNLGFDHWECGRKHKTHNGMPVTKQFESFREEVLILSGFFEQTFDLNGNMKLTAKSISFASMEEPEFNQVYNAVLDVLLERVFVLYKDREEVNEIVEKIMGFL